jgi:hypothetical protein
MSILFNPTLSNINSYIPFYPQYIVNYYTPIITFSSGLINGMLIGDIIKNKSINITTGLSTLMFTIFAQINIHKNRNFISKTAAFTILNFIGGSYLKDRHNMKTLYNVIQYNMICSSICILLGFAGTNVCNYISTKYDVFSMMQSYLNTTYIIGMRHFKIGLYSTKKVITHHDSIPNVACSVCDDVCSTDTIVLSTCTHNFHTKCLGNWFEYNDRCPICG